MISTQTHIIFEVLGVVLGIYLLIQGIMLYKVKKMRLFSIINIIAGALSIIIDGLFIYFNLK